MRALPFYTYHGFQHYFGTRHGNFLNLEEEKQRMHPFD
jgi:hypothetical protein